MQGLLYFNPPVQVEKLKDEVDGKEKIVNSLLGRLFYQIYLLAIACLLRDFDGELTH